MIKSIILVIMVLFIHSYGCNYSFNKACNPVDAIWRNSIVSIASLTIILASTHANAYDLCCSYISNDGHFSFQYSNDLVMSPKPLQTHKFEVFLKSKSVKGFNVGFTVRMK
jgi:hypothetical protein